MNEKKYQSLRKKSISKGNMACIVMLVHALSFFLIADGFRCTCGGCELKHSIVLKTTGGKGE
jgi:hypothetical protein